MLEQWDKETLAAMTRKGIALARARGRKIGRPLGSKDLRPRRKSGYFIKYHSCDDRDGIKCLFCGKLIPEGYYKLHSEECARAAERKRISDREYKKRRYQEDPFYRKKIAIAKRKYHCLSKEYWKKYNYKNRFRIRALNKFSVWNMQPNDELLNILIEYERLKEVSNERAGVQVNR